MILTSKYHCLFIGALAAMLTLSAINDVWSQQCPDQYEFWEGYQYNSSCDDPSCGNTQAIKNIIDYQSEISDPIAGFPIFPSNSQRVLKLGDASRKYTTIDLEIKTPGNLLTDQNNKVMIRYAIITQKKPNSGDWMQRPRFSMSVGNETTIPCGYTEYKIDENYNKFKINNNYYYLEWTTTLVDLSVFSNLDNYPSIFVFFQTGMYRDESGIPTPLVGYVYIDLKCYHPEVSFPAEICKGEPITVQAPFEANDNSSFSWSSGDIETAIGKEITHTYQQEGTYTMTMQYTDEATLMCPTKTFSAQVKVIDCKIPPFVCETCIPDFSPLPGERYILSAWVRQGDGVGYTTYSSPGIQISFMQGIVTEKFRAHGNVIDGWQQIIGEFIVPDNAKRISIQLSNDDQSEEVFFDDIRIQPFNSSLKSFVYDPVSLRLVAELDERNFASFYEYDEEGGLVRVKKETERGIKTISESRTALRKRKPK